MHKGGELWKAGKEKHQEKGVIGVKCLSTPMLHQGKNMVMSVRSDKSNIHIRS